jgi:hypothetical protein
VIPFLALGIAPWLAGPETKALAAAALEGYGAAILSFLGGCRWGFAAAGLGPGPGWAPLGVAVLPALYAWGVALLPVPVSLSLLALGFVGLLAADLALARAGGAPGWWPRLRSPLTGGAVAGLLLGAFA